MSQSSFRAQSLERAKKRTSWSALNVIYAGRRLASTALDVVFTTVYKPLLMERPAGAKLRTLLLNRENVEKWVPEKFLFRI